MFLSPAEDFITQSPFVDFSGYFLTVQLDAYNDVRARGPAKDIPRAEHSPDTT